MTKIDAIIKVLQSNNGTGTLQMIYDNICKFYPSAKNSDKWDAGIRGVLYREIKEGSRLKKIGVGIYALSDYKEESLPSKPIRTHSYMEGICVELGNLFNFDTYSADPSELYRDNIKIGDITTIKRLPDFSYPDIIHDVKNIDVIWFNNTGYKFPKIVLEVVDSVGTMSGAFNRSLQLKDFKTIFIIIAPEKHRNNYLKTLSLQAYNKEKSSFKFYSYNELLDVYDGAIKTKMLNPLIY